MSASKHTPGPWLYRGKSDAVYTTPSDPAYQYGSQIFRFEEEEGPNEDDLNLILAAPDLILALRDAVAALGGITSDNVPQTIRAAIAKATGSAA